MSEEVVPMAGVDAMRERIAALGHVGALSSLERTAAIRSTAGAPAVRLRGCGRPARRTTGRSCGGGAGLGPRREAWAPPGEFGPLPLPLDEALDFVATEGFFWINA